MKRRLRLAAAMIFAGICLAVSALWCRSYFRYDRVVYASTPRQTQLHLGAESVEDTIAIGYAYWRSSIGPNSAAPRSAPFPPGLVRSLYYPLPPSQVNPTRRFADQNGFQFGGFGYFVWPIPGESASNYGLLVPHWFLAALSAAAAWLCFPAHRFGEGLCSRCGYDLRATPEQGGALLARCPECGTIPADGRRA